MGDFIDGFWFECKLLYFDDLCSFKVLGVLKFRGSFFFWFDR